MTSQNGGQGRRSVGQILRGYFLTGLVVAAPVIITAYFLTFVIESVDSLVRPFFPQQFARFGVPGLGLLVVVMSLTLLGAITANVIGRWLLRIWDALLLRVPIVRAIYRPVKQMFDTIIGPDSQSFREVVLAPYPHPDSWAIAFVTSPAPPQVSKALAGKGAAEYEARVTVYVPTAPNLYAGYLLILPRSALRPLDMSVDEAIRTIVSMGTATRKPNQIATD